MENATGQDTNDRPKTASKSMKTKKTSLAEWLSVPRRVLKVT